MSRSFSDLLKFRKTKSIQWKMHVFFNISSERVIRIKCYVNYRIGKIVRLTLCRLAQI